MVPHKPGAEMERPRTRDETGNIWMWDLSSGDLYWPEELKELFGIAPGARVTREALLDAVHPDDRDRAEREVRHSLATPGEHRLEVRVLRPDGTVRPLVASARVYSNRAGRPARILGIVRQAGDIGSRLLDEIVQNSPVAISVVAGPEFVYELANPAFQALAPGKQMIGRRFEDVWPESAEPLRCLRNVHESGRTVQMTDAPAIVQRRPGEPPERIYISFSWIPLPPDRVLTLAVETTESVLRREELATAVAQSDAVMNSMSEGLIIADREGRIVRMNPAAARLYRVAGEERPRMLDDLGALRMYDPEGRPVPMNERPLWRLLRGETVAAEEFRLERADSGETWFGRYSGNVIRDGAGEIALAVLTCEDITGRKRDEERMAALTRRLEAHLENTPLAVLELTPDLTITRWSEGAERIFGYPAADMVGRTLSEWQWMYPEDLSMARTIVGEILEGSRNRVVHRARNCRKDGSVAYCEWYVSGLRDEKQKVQSLLALGLDITERHKMEQALRLSEQRFRSFMDHSPAIAWIKDADGRHVYANASFERVYRLTATDWRGKTDMELWPRHIAEQFRANDLRVLAEKRAVHVVEESIDPEGKPHLWSNYKFPVSDPSGKRYVGGIGIDVTEQKGAEQALRESEEYFRSVAESIPQLVWSARRDGKIDYVNARFREYTGTEAAGREWTDYLRPEDAGRIIPGWKDALCDAREYRTECRMRRAADGSYRWFVCHAVPLRGRDGEITRWLGTCSDIHDQKVAEAQLRYQYSITDAIAQDAAEALFMMDPEGRITFMNRAAEEMFGWSRQELSGEFMHEKTHQWRPDGTPLPASECPLLKVFATGVTLSGHEDTFFRKDNKPVEVVCSCAPILREGVPQAAVVVVHDNSERKRAEERLRQTQKLESMGVLAGGIAHDFNNLLTGIMGYASILMDHVPPDLADHVRTIMASAETGANLTQQMLAYAGKGRWVRQHLDLSDVVREMTDLLRLTAPRAITLEFDLKHGLPEITGDVGQIQQVLLNLTLNAAEAVGERPEGKVRLATGVERVERPFADDLGHETAPGLYVALEVSDNGSGMDPETKARVFEPFFSTKFIGRGLGLSAVSGIVRREQGAITIKTAPGSGTTVRVLFPPAEKIAEFQPAKTVLIVDDEEAVRTFLSDTLRRAGYEVLAARNGQEALALWEQAPERIALVLLDVVMPVMGGSELLQQVRRKRPTTKVLLTSGYSAEEVRRMCGACEMTEFIRKPYTAQKLVERVNAILS